MHLSDDDDDDGGGAIIARVLFLLYCKSYSSCTKWGLFGATSKFLFFIVSVWRTLDLWARYIFCLASAISPETVFSCKANFFFRSPIVSILFRSSAYRRLSSSISLLSLSNSPFLANRLWLAALHWSLSESKALRSYFVTPLFMHLFRAFSLRFRW